MSFLSLTDANGNPVYVRASEVDVVAIDKHGVTVVRASGEFFDVKDSQASVMGQIKNFELAESEA